MYLLLKEKNGCEHACGTVYLEPGKSRTREVGLCAFVHFCARSHKVNELSRYRRNFFKTVK